MSVIRNEKEDNCKGFGRVVILGGSGFIGQHLTAYLSDRKVEVVPLSSQDIDLSEASASEQLASVIKNGDTVIFASCITRDKGGENLTTFMKNLHMAVHVGHFIENHPISHLIYLSSDAVYKDGLSLYREETEKEPGGLYGLAQLTREKMISHSARVGGIPLMIVRPCAVYGPGDTHNGYGPNRFLKAALADGEISLFGNGEERRDHIFVGDLCELVKLCLQQKSIGVLNLATGRAVSFWEVAQAVTKLLHKPVEIISQPRNTPISHKGFDTTNLIRAFPLFSCHSLEEGLKETLG